jgi:orotate phosphoribosyltransferase
MAQIEGTFGEGARVLLVEDLATDGGSKKIFTDALRQAGAVVEHAFVVFYYGVFPHAEATLRELGLRLHALATWWDVLPEARALGRFPPETLAEVEKFLEDPVGWSGAHGGRAAV